MVLPAQLLTIAAQGPPLYVTIWRRKDGPRTERKKIFIVAVGPWHRYSNEAEKVNEHLWWFQIKKNPSVSIV